MVQGCEFTAPKSIKLGILPINVLLSGEPRARFLQNPDGAANHESAPSSIFHRYWYKGVKLRLPKATKLGIFI